MLPFQAASLRFPAFAILGALLASGAWAPAVLAQEVTLRLAVPAGTTIGFDESNSLDLAMTIKVLGQSLQVAQTITSRMVGTSEVLEVGPDGAPARAQVTFDPASSVNVTVNGQAQAQPFPLAGQTVTLSRDGAGVVVDPDPGASLDASTRADLGSYLDLSRPYLPNGPVAVGATWEGSLSSGAGAEMAVPATFTLAGLSERDGREVADATFTATLSGPMEGMTMEGSGGGTASFDVATGVLLAMSASMEATISGQTVVEGVTAEASGTSKITGEIANTLVLPGGEGAASAVETAPATLAVPEATSAPDDTATTETYADATLTVRLTGDQVEIVQGGQTYPGRITRRTGSTIEGEFTASGTPFPFTATLAGERLTLESGGGTYQLDRQVPVANPLGD